MKVFAVFLFLAVALCLFKDSNAQYNSNTQYNSYPRYNPNPQYNPNAQRPRQSPGRPIGRNGICPNVDGIAGACVFDPNVNCLDDRRCGPNQKCCSVGCGSECLRVYP
ncbi:unnamed protein product [Allacma fusca]|uniref:WAP domain-containing protein n=1 Tax=Allacma fusca TaxID=39272 RepID=A0A8J2Q583_9HEXA|nr:unnamed protein product [Allacma fusca]